MYFWGGSGSFYFFDTDFYRKAVVAVQHGVPMYEAMAYPPFAYLLIWWLPALPMVVGDQIWTAVSFVVLIAVGFLLTARALHATGQDWRDDRGGLVIRGSVNSILLMISMPMFSQFTCGQLSLFVAALAFVDVSGVLPKRFQGTLVGLAAAIKVTPMIFAVYYLVTGQRRQALNSLASFAAFTAFGALFFPSETLAFWTRLTSTGQDVDPKLPYNLGIRSMLARISLDLIHSSWLWAGLGLLLMVVTLWRARKLYRRNQAMEAALVVGAASIVVTPNVLPHYFLWLPLAAIWLVMTGTRVAKVLGVAIYLLYSLLYYMVVLPSLVSIDEVWWNGLSVVTIVPILIGVFGLPKRPAVAAAEDALIEPVAELV
jgi:alpha-1,2-mannosyltransferase